MGRGEKKKQTLVKKSSPKNPFTMWKITFSKQADKEFGKLSSEIKKRISRAIDEKLQEDPEKFLIPLVGKLFGLYKFRIGDYRLICEKHDREFRVLIIKVKHRKEAYK